MKPSRIGRIVQLLTTLQSGHRYTAAELAKLMGISRRTLFRDLKELSSIGVPYNFDRQTGGYQIDPEFFLPPVDLTLQEALGLLLLIHKGRSHLPVPFKNSLFLAGVKIENNLPQNIRKYCNTSLQNVSVKPSPHSPMDSLDGIFSKLQTAVRKNKKARLQYNSLYENQRIVTTLSPYHIMYNRRAWYVVGYSSMHKAIRTFKFNRIKEMKILQQGFMADKKFDAIEHFKKAWAIIPEGRMYDVRLRFAPKVAKNVAEVQWHNSQVTAINPDGSVTAEFRVDGLGEIGWWILGYGDQVEVIKPAKLRKHLAETAKRMATINKPN